MKNTQYSNTDFLRFSAYSIKELITRKLTEDSRFTDQVYEGSNLAVLIDIFSYLAQCMLYQLNNAAAESMFSDTMIYENMNRLIKFIDYHPCGIGNRTMTFTCSNSDVLKDKTLLKYSYIDTNLTDSYGKKIYYSLIENKTINSSDEVDITFYNGKWKLYNTVFTSSGEPYQKFILTGLKSTKDSTSILVANNMIHVYIDENNVIESGTGFLTQYNTVDTGLFSNKNSTESNFIYSSNDEIYDLRLNENKTYEITFGNGQLGKIPPKDASIYIMYLDANASHELIAANSLTKQILCHGHTNLGLSTKIFRAMFHFDETENNELNQIDNSDIYNKQLWKNTTQSLDFQNEETVNDIRQNAPGWFKTGNRLVTVSDYQYFFKNKNSDLITDVVCQNNYTYITTFYRWLYNIGSVGVLKTYGLRKKSILGNQYYLNQNRMIKYDYKWSDASDANNVYLWIKMKNNSDMLKAVFNDQIENIKDMTQEVVYLNPLNMYFAICAETIDMAINYFKSDIMQFDPNNYNYIEITLDDNCIYSNNDITLKITNILQEYFSEDNLKLGQLVDYSTIVNQIYNIGAISQVRTIYHNIQTGEISIKPGVAFATWTSEFIDSGDDLDVSTTSKQLEPFQFPILYNINNISNKIKIIRKTINNINTLQF